MGTDFLPPGTNALAFVLSRALPGIDADDGVGGGDDSPPLILFDEVCE